MFKNRSLEIEMIEKSMQILSTVIAVHIAGVLIRFLQYLIAIAGKLRQENNLSTKLALCALSIINLVKLSILR